MSDATPFSGSIFDRQTFQALFSNIRSRACEPLLSFCNDLLKKEQDLLELLHLLYDIPYDIVKISKIPPQTQRKVSLEDEQNVVLEARNIFVTQTADVIKWIDLGCQNLAFFGQKIFQKNLPDQNYLILWSPSEDDPEIAFHTLAQGPLRPQARPRYTSAFGNEGSDPDEKISPKQAIEMIPAKMTEDRELLKKLYESMISFQRVVVFDQTGYAFDKTGYRDAGIETATTAFLMIEHLKEAAANLKSFCVEKEELHSSLRESQGMKRIRLDSTEPNDLTIDRPNRKKRERDRYLQ